MNARHTISNSPVSLYGIDGVEAVSILDLDIGHRSISVQNWIGTDGSVTATTVNGQRVNELPDRTAA